MWTLLLPLSWAWPGLVANGEAALVVSGTEADGTRLTRVDEAGRPLGFVDVPGERPCAAVPWKEGFALVSVAPDGEGSRFRLRPVDPQGRPGAPVELGRGPEHPTFASEWACKVAGSEAAVIVVWRRCEELRGHECSLYDGETQLTGAWWDGAAVRAWTAPATKGGQDAYAVAAVGREAWIYGEDNAEAARVPSLWHLDLERGADPSSRPVEVRDSSARFAPGTSVLVHRSSPRSFALLDVATGRSTPLDDPGGGYAFEQAAARRPDGRVTAWTSSTSSASGRAEEVVEARVDAAGLRRTELPWSATPRAAAFTAKGSLLLFEVPGRTPLAVWGFDPEGRPRTSRPVPVGGAWRADVAAGEDRGWVAFADESGVRWGTTDGLENHLAPASERPADDVAVAPGAVAWTDGSGAHVRTARRTLDLPELGQLGLAAREGGYLLVAERRDRYEVELLELDAELGVKSRRGLGAGRDPAVACDGAGCTAAWVDAGQLAARDLATDTALPATPGAWARSPRVHRVAGGADITWLDSDGPVQLLRRSRLGEQSAAPLGNELGPASVGIWQGALVYADSRASCRAADLHTLLGDGCRGAAWSGPWLAGFTEAWQPFVHHAELVTSTGVPIPALRPGIRSLSTLAEVRVVPGGLRVERTLSGVRHDGLVVPLLPGVPGVDGVAAFAPDAPVLRLVWTTSGKGAALIRRWAEADRWPVVERLLLHARVEDSPSTSRTVTLRADGELRWERRERDCVGPRSPEHPVCDPAPDRVDAVVGRLNDRSRALLLAAVRETDPALAEELARALDGDPAAAWERQGPPSLVELAPSLPLSGRGESREF